MAAPIQIHSDLFERIIGSLKDADVKKKKCFGFLLGRWTEESLVVSSCYKCLNATADSVQHNIQEVYGLIPVGLTICGLFFFRPKDYNVSAALRDIRLLSPNKRQTSQEHSWPDHILVMMFNDDDYDVNPDDVFWYHQDGRDVSSAKFSVIEDPSLTNSVTLRLQGSIKFTIEFDKNKDVACQRIASHLQHHIDIITSSQTFLKIKNSDIILHKDGVFSRNVDCSSPCSELFKYITDESQDDGFEIEKTKKKDYNKEIIQINVLRKVSAEGDIGVVPTHTPVIHQDEASRKLLTVYLPLDVICNFPPDELSGNITRQIIRGVVDQLASMGRCLCQYYDGELHTPVVCHFKPWTDGHLLSIIYPKEYDDEQLVEYRKMMHQKFLLPSDRPLLRLCNRYKFPLDAAYTDGLLRNTHVGLVSPTGGDDYLVSGVYAYHHYMQDRIDDNGWGCAYRSLQTVMSWFNHQGYSQVPIPSHKEIQQALVEVKDKEQSFVGTKRWIGSTEVSYCLDFFLDVQSKIMFVSNGADLANKGRELMQHFITQGTPIMIGGGVLAHTILGVNYNSVTGDLKFLILDPHYTGGEDLKKIQSKGWCGWKGPDFWDQHAYYNLCMPQRPLVI